MFSDCKNLPSITIPNSVKYIDQWAFYNCSSLSTIVIPNKVEKINNEVFKNCSNLISVVIGKGVKYIGKNLFEGCPKLETITCLATTPPNLAIDNEFPPTVTLLVPKGSLEKYKESDWNNYFDGRIKEME